MSKLTDNDFFFGCLFCYAVGASFMFGYSLYWDEYTYVLSWFTRIIISAFSGTLTMALYIVSQNDFIHFINRKMDDGV